MLTRPFSRASILTKSCFPDKPSSAIGSLSRSKIDPCTAMPISIRNKTLN